MKFVPASTAACSAASDSASSTAPQEPPMAQAPKLTDETGRPVRPSVRWFMGESLSRAPWHHAAA